MPRPEKENEGEHTHTWVLRVVPYIPHNIPRERLCSSALSYKKNMDACANCVRVCVSMWMNARVSASKLVVRTTAYAVSESKNQRWINENCRHRRCCRRRPLPKFESGTIQSIVVRHRKGPHRLACTRPTYRRCVNVNARAVSTGETEQKTIDADSLAALRISRFCGWSTVVLSVDGMLAAGPLTEILSQCTVYIATASHPSLCVL